MTIPLNLTARHSLLRIPFWTFGYFGIIVLANMMLLWFDPLLVGGSAIPPAIFASGFVFVFRDFAQREIGHFVLAAIFAAAGTTFWLAGPEVALASSSAFLIAELVDWIIYSVTKRSMSDRVLISSLVSVPLDTAVFYALLGILDPLALALGVGIKLVGTMMFWIVLRCAECSKHPSPHAASPKASKVTNQKVTYALLQVRSKGEKPTPNERLGTVEIDFLREYVEDFAALMVEKNANGFDVYLLATGDNDTIEISSFVRDHLRNGGNHA